MGWPVQLNLLNRVFVGINYTFHTIALRIKNIAIQCETVICTIIYGRDRRTKTQSRDLLIVIVVLQDVADTLDSLEVLILLQVQVVK